MSYWSLSLPEDEEHTRNVEADDDNRHQIKKDDSVEDISDDFWHGAAIEGGSALFSRCSRWKSSTLGSLSLQRLKKKTGISSTVKVIVDPRTRT